MPSYSTSVIQLYTNALITSLRARAGLADTIITDGPPPASIMQATEWLALLDVHGEQHWSAIDSQRRPKDETFTIDGLISVISSTTDGDTEIQSIVNNRAMAILAELELELRANPTQGVGPSSGINPAGYVIESQLKSPLTLSKRASGETREAAFEFGVFVKARL